MQNSFFVVVIDTMITPIILDKIVKNKQRLGEQLYYFFIKDDHKYARLMESAKWAPDIIYDLTAKKQIYPLCKAYFQILFRFKQIIFDNLDRAKAHNLYEHVPYSFLIEYVLLFQLHLSGKEKHQLSYNLFNKLLMNKQIKEIQNLLLYLNTKQITLEVINKYIQRRRFKQAAVIIKAMKIEQSNYPELIEQLYISAALSLPRWLKNYTWHHLEECLSQRPYAIAANIKSQLRKKQDPVLIQGFASICSRIPKVYQYLPQNICTQLSKYPPLSNMFYSKQFVSFDQNQFISLEQYELFRKDVVFVQRKYINDCFQQICSSNIIGIDTESIVMSTVFESSFDKLALVQIATFKKIFLFDAIDLKLNMVKIDVFQQFISNKQNCIVGHTLKGDLTETLQLFGINRKKVNCMNIDVQLEANKRGFGLIGLSSLCKEILGKPLFKLYQLSNWTRRPLFKAQIHYAALDSFVVLKVWEKLQHLPLVQQKKRFQKNKKSQQQLVQQKEEKNQVLQTNQEQKVIIKEHKNEQKQFVAIK